MLWLTQHECIRKDDSLQHLPNHLRPITVPSVMSYTERRRKCQVCSLHSRADLRVHSGLNPAQASSHTLWAQGAGGRAGAEKNSTSQTQPERWSSSSWGNPLQQPLRKQDSGLQPAPPGLETEPVS